MLNTISKNSLPRLVGLALIGGLGLLLGSGCQTTSKAPTAPVEMDTLQQAVDASISDPERAAEVLALLEETTQIMVDRTAYLETYNKRLKALTRDYGTSEDEIRAVIEGYNDYRHQKQDRMVEILENLRELLTTEEWESLDSIRTRQVDALMEGARWL